MSFRSVSLNSTPDGDTMPDKSVAQKLLFKENYTVLLLNEPGNYRETLGELPAKV